MRPNEPLLIAITLSAGCATVPGDEDTLVLDGEPIAGYAWSGPDSWDYAFENPDDGLVVAGWQVWFTNTDYCPSRATEILGSLRILGPDRVVPPSSGLPTITVGEPIWVYPFVSTLTFDEPGALLNTGEWEVYKGTVTLSGFSEAEVHGTFDTTARGPFDENDRGLRGTFVARPCSRIHP